MQQYQRAAVSPGRPGSRDAGRAGGQSAASTFSVQLREKGDHQSDRMSPAVHARREDSLQITMAHRQPASGPALVHSHTRTAAAYAHINATVPCRYISGKHGSPAGRASGAHARHTVPGHCRLPPYVLKDDNDGGKERPPGAAEPSDDGQSPAGIKCRHRGRALRPTTAERGPWPRSLEK